MNSVRVRFIRGEEVKYISHLDLMKVFERAIRRAVIPIAYSEGFNPHPHMVFGLPLSVGVTSQAEYADFEFTEELVPDEFMEKLNNDLPSGLKIIEARTKNSKNNIMASISAASYDILIAAAKDMGTGTIGEKLGRFMQEASVIIEKEGKRGKKDIDIRPMIMRLEPGEMGDGQEEYPDADINSKYTNQDMWLRRYVESLYSADVLHPSYSRESILRLNALLSAGSIANLKPELLIEAFGRYTGQEFKTVKIHRTGLFVGREGRLLDPLDSNVL